MNATKTVYHHRASCTCGDGVADEEEGGQSPAAKARSDWAGDIEDKFTGDNRRAAPTHLPDFSNISVVYHVWMMIT
jgi:hypothetical protein